MQKVFIKCSMAILMALLTLGSACTQSASETRRRPDSLKRHAFLKIPSQLIRDHVSAGGTSIVLEFREQDSIVVLQFTGFSPDSITKEELLPTLSQTPRPLKNVYYGQFRNDESARSLHSILTASPIRPWYLRPRKYKDSPNAKYVAYDLSDQPFTGPGNVAAALVIKINPSPPCCM